MNLITPFSNKPYVIPLWLENFKQLDLPRSEIDLVWLDISDNVKIREQLLTVLEQEKDKFRSVRYIDNVVKKEPVLTAKMPRFGTDIFATKMRSITETMNILFSYVEGDTLLWEDDILVPTNAYTKLKQVFDWSDDIYGATVVQYVRKDQADNLLVWDWLDDLYINKSSLPDRLRLPSDREKEAGIEAVGATGTGFILFAGALLKQHPFINSGSKGHDIMAGYAIRQQNKYLLLDWSIKSTHVGFVNGEIKRYVSRNPLYQ